MPEYLLCLSKRVRESRNIGGCPRDEELKKSLIWTITVCLIVSLLLAIPCAAYGDSSQPFIRIDKDDPDYWEGELSNVRLIADQLYEFQEMDEGSGVDPDFMPVEEGLDTLCI